MPRRRGQFELLAGRYRVIRYDVRGFGRSALPTGAEFRYADDLRALLDYLDAPRAHLVGLSMGGRNRYSSRAALS
ncbi:MAG: alpha/beta hydrolase [Candidatus Eremiobacteraeota bacterium]|nr:alpha/beta hydrolase [Candidatus Eremiobacteraeota bacterium]